MLVFLAACWRTDPGRAHTVGGLLLILGSYGFAATYNDVGDLAIDRANRRSLPLVDGSIGLAGARRLMAGCFVGVALAQAFLHQPRGLAVTAAAVLTGVAYSHPRIGIERRGALATVLLAVGYVGWPLVLAGGSLDVSVVVAALAATAAMLLYKDVKDEAGDRQYGKATPLVRWGIGRVDRVAGALLGCAIVAALGTAPAPAAVLAVALAGQRRMVAAGRYLGPDLRFLQVPVVAGVIALAAV
jgi:4-hydroxybenzoate polyprenyltransferase